MTAAAWRDAWRDADEESTRTQSGELADRLTPRQLEIIRLIASLLVGTTNRIKKPTSNIYSKPGIRSRAQAITHAHELN